MNLLDNKFTILFEVGAFSRWDSQGEIHLFVYYLVGTDSEMVIELRTLLN
jgi:hypothetical protein